LAALGGAEPPPVVVDAREHLGDGHGALGRVLARAVRREPAQRYQTARELQCDLETLAEGSIVGRLRLMASRLPSVTWALGSVGVVALVWALLSTGAADIPDTAAAARKSVEAAAPIAWVVETVAGPSPMGLPLEADEAGRASVAAEASLKEIPAAELRAGQFIKRAFKTEGEVHRVTVRAVGGRGYLIATANLAPEVDTLLDVFYDGRRVSNDDAWPGTLASSVFVMPEQDTALSVRVTNRGVIGEDATYELVVVEADPTPTPTTEPAATLALDVGVTMTPRPTYTPRGTATVFLGATRTPRPTSTRRPTYTPRPTMSPTASMTPLPSPTWRPTATATPPRTALPVKTATTPVW